MIRRARYPTCGCDAVGVFERFTGRARNAVVLAQAEARELRFSHIGTEALLLGLLREYEGQAARVLESFDITLDLARAQVLRRVGSGEGPPTAGQIPFTPRAKSVLERANDESVELGHTGTEALLLAQGVHPFALDVDSTKIRKAMTQLLAGEPVRTASRRSPSQTRARGANGRPMPISSQDEGFRVEQGADVARLMMSAAARALEDGRTEINAGDLLIALSRAKHTGPLLAKLGADEAAIRDGLKLPQGPEEPPEASASS